MVDPTGKLQRLCEGALPWHQHRSPYLAIVFEGGYEEYGDEGRVPVEAGSAILHLPFDGHANRITRAGARLVNVKLTIAESFAVRSVRLDDPEQVVAAIQEGQSVTDALALAQSLSAAVLQDESDALAQGIIANEVRSLDGFAAENGIAPRTLRRRFQTRYGMSAAKFRARARARRALRDILTSDLSLAAIACDLEFSDQAHMSRTVSALTGSSPVRLRRTLAV